MSDYNYDPQTELYSLTIDTKKREQFQKWCQENQIDEQLVFAKIIDACLDNNHIIKSFICDQNNHFSLKEEIEFYLDKSLQPLINRIEQLEQQIDQSSSREDNSPATAFSAALVEQDNPSPTPLDESKITYLPRNQVWKKLKQTDYVKYSGYDNFLKARGDEFIEYGIFFDPDKKRYYIWKEEE